MSSAALFGNTSRSSTKNLVEFRAGKMHMKGTQVSPDRRKGLVYLHQTEDSLMHFCWKDRATGTVEEDLIIFPEDCEYQHIKQCTTGRVYALKFKSTSRRIFFWLQEPKTDKDEENCRKINDLLNNPPTPGSHSASRGSGSGGSGGDLRESELQSILGNISQQQLMQILGNNVPSMGNILPGNSSGGSKSSSGATSTATSSSGASSGGRKKLINKLINKEGNPINLSDLTTEDGDQLQISELTNILTGIMGKEGTSSQQKAESESVDLSLAMTSEALQPILSDPEFVQQLSPFLPATGETMPSAEQLRGTVTSPQFQQAVSLFSSVLQSGSLGSLVQQFGLGDEAVAAAEEGNLESFVKALGKKKKEEKEEEKEDENMAVD